MASTATTFLASILLSLIAFSDGAVGECEDGTECVPFKSCKATLEGLATDLIQDSVSDLFPEEKPLWTEAITDELKKKSCGKKGERRMCCDIKDIIKTGQPTTTSAGQPTTTEPSTEPPTTSGPSVVVPIPIDGPSELGNLTTFVNSEVSGTVLKLSDTFLLIEDFNYNGKGLAVFVAGTTGFPRGDGEVVLPFPESERTFSISDPDLPILDATVGSVALKIPTGFTVDQLKWIALWSTEDKEVLASLQIERK